MPLGVVRLDVSMNSLVFAGFPRSWVAPHGTYIFQSQQLLMAETVDVSHIMSPQFA